MRMVYSNIQLFMKEHQLEDVFKEVIFSHTLFFSVKYICKLNI